MRFLVNKCRIIKKLNTDKSHAISYNRIEVYFYSKEHCPLEPIITDNEEVYTLDIPEWMFVKFDWKQKLDIDLIHKEARDEYELQRS